MAASDSTTAPVTSRTPWFGGDDMLIRAALILGFILMVWKLYIGLISHVIWEEGHFVISGQYLALGYPDIPAGFAWLARLITTLFGWHVFPLRLVSLLIATAIPYAVYFMAKPAVSRREAIWAAIVAMLLPTASMNGTVYYPEGTLQLLLALMLGCLLRAIQQDRLKWWIWTGVCAALGLLVHFRFLIPGLFVVLFLAANAQGRALWRKPGLYITAAIAVLGLLPSLIYNATHQWPAIEFHVVNRPHFDPDPRHILGFLETQIGIVTPAFFIGLVVAARVALVQDRDRPGTLLGYQSAGIFLFYCLQALVNKKIMPHWPFMAYIPLLAYVPGVLIRFADRATRPATRYLRLALIGTSPLIALILGIVGSVYQYDYVHSAELPYKQRQFNVLKNENWTLLEPDLASASARAVARFGPDIAWAASGHISAVHIEFPGIKGRRLYTLDEPYDVLTSRFVVARHDWGLDRAALMHNQAGKGVVLALIESNDVYHDPEQVKFMQALCRSFDDIEPYKVSTLPPGRTAIDLFTARVRSTPAPAQKAPCALVPALYVPHPSRGEFVTKNDHHTYSGIAADPQGIRQVDILIDRKFVVTAHYGVQAKDFPTPDMLNYDPNWPKVQYDFQFPQDSLVSGQHSLTIEATRNDGTQVQSQPRILYVK